MEVVVVSLFLRTITATCAASQITLLGARDQDVSGVLPSFGAPWMLAVFGEALRGFSAVFLD